MNDLKATTSLIEPFGLEIDLDKGAMPGAASRTVRKASDMQGYYADEAALKRLVDEQRDPLHYEVFETPVPQEYGHQMYCISSLQPGLVGDEFFMTKGHYHTVVETGEIYLCLRGQGFMMMKTSDGEARWEKMSRGRMVYVPPYWAHRSINTGKEPLISYCVYPADAGHNYGDIEQDGFPIRIFLRERREVFE
jgi:glucose-6-phosphate isomerase